MEFSEESEEALKHGTQKDKNKKKFEGYYVPAQLISN